ncbi:MAG: transcription elongation factor GreA [Candidatus Nomurabacteria bacterium]|nr:transcription elongation factor GreA [Candidatus Nomurabacteria bacterium]
MNPKADYITEEKKKALMAELEQLKGPKRKEIIEALASAKALGDLSENAEYHNAREEQGKLEERIKEIEKILQNSEVVTATGGDIVLVGSKVVVNKEGTKEEVTYFIVGAEEADMATGKISHKSPLGVALYGKKKGDSVTFTTPRGAVNYKIINVS